MFKRKISVLLFATLVFGGLNGCASKGHERYYNKVRIFSINFQHRWEIKEDKKTINFIQIEWPMHGKGIKFYESSLIVSIRKGIHFLREQVYIFQKNAYVINDTAWILTGLSLFLFILALPRLKIFYNNKYFWVIVVLPLIFYTPNIIKNAEFGCMRPLGSIIICFIWALVSVPISVYINKKKRIKEKCNLGNTVFYVLVIIWLLGIIYPSIITTCIQIFHMSPHYRAYLLRDFH